MKLHQLTEVRYAGSLEAESVLYTLWKERKKIQNDNLSVVKIDDPALSKKRAAAVARYAVRVIVPEVFDGIGLTDEAQRVRDLPTDVDLEYARHVAREVARAAYYNAANADAADAADAAATTAADAVDYAIDAYGGAAATRAAIVTFRTKRPGYHLNQMIKIVTQI